MQRALVALVIAAGIAVGLLAEQQANDWADVHRWLPDVVVGWVLIGAGVSLLSVSRPRQAPVLMLVAGFSWFLFNFSMTGPAALQWLSARGAFVHRGALLALAVTLPGRRARIGVSLAGVAAFAWPLWDNDYTALALCAVFVAVTAVGFATARGRRGRTIGGRALVAIVVLASGIAVGAISSLAGASQAATDMTVHLYEVAVAACGLILLTAAHPAARSAFVDRAVELERNGMTLRDVLRHLLGDPELDILPTESLSPAPRPGLVETPLRYRGLDAGVLLHAPGTLGDGETGAAILAAAGLAAERAKLQAEVERQAEAVAASGQRLLLAEDDERRRLAETLDRTAGVALEEIERLVGDVRVAASESLGAALDRAAAQVARARPELDAIVRGLGGVEPELLVSALEQLAADLPVEVTLTLDYTPLPEPAAAAIWFVCAEALANTVKHADARAVRVELAIGEESVLLRVEDDGRGGADPAGSGLAGLSDRVSTLGGRLTIDSTPGAGTRVSAELPLPGRAS